MSLIEELKDQEQEVEPQFTPRVENNPFTPAPLPGNPYKAEASRNIFSYWRRSDAPSKKPGEMSVYVWGKKGGNLNPAIYNPQVEAQIHKPYWSEPQRVVRYKQMLDTLPPEVPVPDWLDKQKINSLYDYLQFINPGKKSEDWDAVHPNDPNFAIVETLTSPPQDLLPNSERDPVYQANAIMDHWKKRYETEYAEYERLLKDYNEEYANKFVEETEKQNEVDFAKLEPFAQFLVATQAITPGKNKPKWMENVELGSMGVKTGMMATGGISMLTSTLGAGATAGSSLGPIGTAIGFAGGLAAGAYAIHLAKTGNLEGATQIMAVFNKPAEWIEQLTGNFAAKSELAALGADTSKIDNKYFYEVGRSFYESKFFELGNLETNIISQAAHFLNPNWSSGKTADIGEVWQIQKGIVEPQAIRQGFLAGNVLAEATMRLYNGEDSTLVYEDMVDRYGFSGTKADFILQSWVDPTQYLPFALSLAGENIAGWAKNPLLADSFKNMRGNIAADAMPGTLQMPTQMAIGLYNRIVLKNTPDGGIPHVINFRPSGGLFDVVDDYRYKLRTATAPLGILPKMTDDYTGFDRLIAKIDKETGMPKESTGIDTQGGVANKRMRNILSDKTPLAKIILLKDNLAGAIENMWERSRHDINRLTDELNKVIAGKASVVTGDAATYYYDSPEARSLAGALKAGMGDRGVKNIMAAWQALAPQRSILNELSMGLKIRPEDILLRIEKGETSALIDEFMKSGVTETNNTFRSLKNNVLDAERLNKLFKTMIRDKIPANTELMFVRFQQELDKGMGQYLAKNYGISESEAPIFRGARLNKSIQSLVLLGLNPTFLVKNFLNNVSTMAYQRVGGLYSASLNAAIYTKYGITPPARAGEGYGMIGIIPKSKKGGKDLIDKAQNVVSKVTEKAAVISNTSMKIEQACSESVVATGVDYVMREEILSGKAFGSMPPQVQTELKAAGIDPNNITGLMKVTFNTEDLGKGPNKKVHVQAKMNEAVEATFIKLGLDPEIGNDLISKTGVIDALTRYMNEDGMSFDDAMATYKRTLDFHILQLKAEELIDTYRENANVVKNSGMPGGVHILNQVQQEEYIFDNLMQQKQYEAMNKARAIRDAAHTGTLAEQQKANIDANALYHIKQIEIDNLMDQHMEERLNFLAPVLNALDAEVPEQARYISAIMAEHKAYVKFQNDKIDTYDTYFDPETAAPAKWEDVQAKVKEIGDTYLANRAALREETATATIAIFGDDANVINKVKVWLESSAKIQAKIEKTDKAFQIFLSKERGEEARDAAWIKRNRIVEELQAQALDLDYKHGNDVNTAIRNMPAEPEVPDADEPNFEAPVTRNSGYYITDPATHDRVWVTDRKPGASQDIDPVTGEFTNALYQPAEVAISKTLNKDLLKPITQMPGTGIKISPNEYLTADNPGVILKSTEPTFLKADVQFKSAGEADDVMWKQVRTAYSPEEEITDGDRFNYVTNKAATDLQKVMAAGTIKDQPGSELIVNTLNKYKAEYDNALTAAKVKWTKSAEAAQAEAIRAMQGESTLGESPIAKVVTDKTIDEYKVDAETEKRLLNINRIEAKYRGGWVNKNAAELKDLKTKLQNQYHMSEPVARAYVALMCIKAEEVTFRTKELDPMAYIRHYDFRAIDEAAFANAKLRNPNVAGTGSAYLDMRRGKWVVEASQLADSRTWLHEMVHTWIVDLDIKDVDVLAKYAGYRSGLALLEAEVAFRNYKTEEGIAFPANIQKFVDAQEKIVSAFEATYFQKAAPFNELQMATVSPSIARGFHKILVDLRDWIVKLYNNFLAEDTKRIDISPEVEQAYYHLINGYRKDQVWTRDPNFQHLPVSKVYLDDLYSNMTGGKHYTNWYEASPEDLQSVYNLAPAEGIVLKKTNKPSSYTPIDNVGLDNTPKAEPVTNSSVKPVEYARYANDGYEVSSAGDKRFSALNARLSDGRTVEEHYQVDYKGYNSIEAGKGKPPRNKDTKAQSYAAYKKLWEQFAEENPELITDLKVKAQGKILTDKFATTDITQAHALADILNASIDKVSEAPVIITGPNSKAIGGFDNRGKGTPDGDGKDKAMRQVASYFVGEISDTTRATSTQRSYDVIKAKPDRSGDIVMLARNAERKGKPLTDKTKADITTHFNLGRKFVVGDMPGVDSAFVDYLNKIGAEYTIFFTGKTNRLIPEMGEPAGVEKAFNNLQPDIQQNPYVPKARPLEAKLRYGRNDILDFAGDNFKELSPATVDLLVKNIQDKYATVEGLKPDTALYEYVKANGISQDQLDSAIYQISHGKYSPDSKLEWNLVFRSIKEVTENLETTPLELRRLLNLTEEDVFRNRLQNLDDTQLVPLLKLEGMKFNPDEGLVYKNRYMLSVSYMENVYRKYQELLVDIRKSNTARERGEIEATYNASKNEVFNYLKDIPKEERTPAMQAQFDQELNWQKEQIAAAPSTTKSKPPMTDKQRSKIIVAIRQSLNNIRKVIEHYETFHADTYIRSLRGSNGYVGDPSDQILGGTDFLTDQYQPDKSINAGLQDPNIPYDLSFKSVNKDMAEKGFYANQGRGESSFTPSQKKAWLTVEERFAKLKMREADEAIDAELYKALTNKTLSPEKIRALQEAAAEKHKTLLLEESKILATEASTAEPTVETPVIKQTPEDQQMTKFANEALMSDWEVAKFEHKPTGFEKQFNELFDKTKGKGPEWEAMLNKARVIRSSYLEDIDELNPDLLKSNQAAVLDYIEEEMFPNMKYELGPEAEAIYDIKRDVVQPGTMSVKKYHELHPNALYQPDPGPALHNDIDSIPTALKQGQAWQEQATDVNLMLKTLRETYNADTKSYGYKGIDKLSPEARAMFDKWLADAAIQLGNAKQKAIRYGLTQRDSALLNYGDRNGFDNYLDMLFPYQFWYTRSMQEWVKRSLNRPSILALAGRRAQMAEKLGKEMGEYPSRLQNRFKIPWAFAEKWMGDSIYTNPWQELMPVNQLLQPLDILNQQYTSIRPDLELQNMVQSGEISQQQMDTSMANQNDQYWAKALATAQSNSDIEDPYALLSMMMTPNWLINEVEARITGRKQPNQPLTNVGLTMQSHADTISAAIGQGDTKVGDAIHDALTWAGKAFEQPEKLIRGNNFAYYGKWGEWLVKRELANMAAEGVPVMEIRKSMIEKRGDLWAQASKRVRDQVSLKTPGSLLARTIEEGEYVNMPWAIVATLFPNGIFPEGEMTQLGLKEDMLKAWDVAAQTGDKTLMNDWFKAHPEYMARAALNDDDDTMLKKFLVNQIMDAYTSEANINKSLIKAHLGNDFLNKILDPDTANGKIDYKALDTEKLVDWARTLRKEIPITEETAQMNNPVGEIKKYSPEEITELTTFFDQREALFPDHAQLNEHYANLQTEKEKTIFLAKYPEIKEYWDWARQYRERHPTVKAWSEKYSDPDQIAQDPYYGLEPAKIQAYYDYKAQNFPNVTWLNTEYFEIDEKDYAGKKAFLAKYPELKAYWDWKDKAEAADPEYLYYNQMQDAMVTKKSFTEKIPADLKPAQVAQALAVLDMDNFVKQDLLDYYVRGTELPFGTTAYLKDLWEQRGKPGSSFDNFIDNLF